MTMSKVNHAENSSVPSQCDVAIIGAGPAGLATAIKLKELGITDIVVLERSGEAGGNPRHCGHSPFGLSEFKRVYLGPGYAAKMRNYAAQLDVKISLNTTVTSFAKGGRLTLSTTHGISQLKAKKVVLTTGIREMPRAPRFISGQRPAGIMTTGALQSMVYLSHKKPFRNPVIVGTELVSFSAIASCRHAGIKPVAMLEQNKRVTAMSALQLLPRLLGIDLFIETQIVDIEGKQQVTGINVINEAGQTRHIACDGIIFSGQFIPEASLARVGHLDIDPRTQGPVVDQYGRCSDADYFSAGNVLRPVETGGWCWSEGTQLAEFIQLSLLNKLPDIKNQLHFDITDEKIKYIVPQRLSLSVNSTIPEGVKNLQLRFNSQVNGTVSVNSSSRELSHKVIRSLPERRVLIPMPCLGDNLTEKLLTVNFYEKK